MSRANLLRTQEDKKMQRKKTQAFQVFQMLTRKDVSTRWQCSIMTLKRMEQAKRLHALKIGRGVRYRLSDILAFEAEAEVTR
jgi:hypothetical protein